MNTNSREFHDLAMTPPEFAAVLQLATMRLATAEARNTGDYPVPLAREFPHALAEYLQAREGKLPSPHDRRYVVHSLGQAKVHRGDDGAYTVSGTYPEYGQ